MVGEAEKVRRFFQRKARKKPELFGGPLRCCVWYGDENYVAARTIGALAVPTDESTCRVIALYKIQFPNLHRRKSLTRVATDRNEETADYARMREGEPAHTDLRVGGALCK